MEYLALVADDEMTEGGPARSVAFPDAPGCLTFVEPGEDLNATAREALEGWLEAHLLDGDAPPRPGIAAAPPAGVERLAVRVPPTLAVRLQLRWAREDQGLSQGQLAKRIGVSRQAIQQLESPTANLRLNTLEKVARALGLALDITLVPAGA